MRFEWLRGSVCLCVFVFLIHFWLQGSHAADTTAISTEKGIQLFVSPQGNDSWSGAIKKPNASQTDGPLASLQGARDAIRKLKAAGKANAPIEVSFLEGTYFIEQPVVFSPEDSGTGQAPITYSAFPGTSPVISGGYQIPGWVRSRLGKTIGTEVWMSELADVKSGKWNFKELFIKGTRCPRTRLPETGYYHFTNLVESTGEHNWNEGNMAAGFKEGDLKEWKNLKDVDIVALTRWIESRSPIASLDMNNHTVNFAKKSTFRLEDTRHPGQFAQYSVENVFEALKKPGQWYLDRTEGMLYYLPKQGESPKTTKAFAPRVQQILRIVGTGEGYDQSVHDIHFKGLIFRHAEWDYPADQAGSSQAAMDVPGAVYLESASRCSVVECNVEQVGTYGIEIGAKCRNIVLSHCSLQDLGAGGIKVGHDSSHTTVEDCIIAHGGRIYPSAIGVWVGNSGDNHIVHNRIHDLFYTGISVGWTWGYGDSKAVRNIVEYNDIFDIGQGMLSDMGGIYTLGISPGTRLTHNLIHDVSAYSYGGWGIYTDEGSSNILIENNVVYKTKTGGFHQHYGKENIVKNNVFALAKEDQLMRTREEEHKSFNFENNIVYFTQGNLLGSNWSNEHFFMDKNIYWNPNKKKILFKEDTFREWQKRGHDKNSLITDPFFVNPAKGDFRLQAKSPAFKLGFQRIDLSEVGPRS